MVDGMAHKEKPDAMEAETLERALVEGYQVRADEDAQTTQEWESVMADGLDCEPDSFPAS